MIDFFCSRGFEIHIGVGVSLGLTSRVDCEDDLEGSRM